MNKQVTRRLNTVTNIIRRRRPINGSMNSPTFIVPDEHRQARQATDEIWNKTESKKSVGKGISTAACTNHHIQIIYWQKMEI